MSAIRFHSHRNGEAHLGSTHKRSLTFARLLAYLVATGMISVAMISNVWASDLSFGLFPSRCAEHRIWQPYANLTFQGDSDREMGEAGLFLPLLEDRRQLLFADIRGRVFDDSSAEGNWGLAYRQIRPSGWIVGGYAFYDLRESVFNNTWHQGTFGGELMNENWDFRMNGYLAEGGAKATGSPSASLSGGTIMVFNSLERAYSGFDGEIGRLLWNSHGRYDVELRGYAGGFHFACNSTGFPNVSGPRARLEMRLYDLNLLGADSRLTLGYQYQYDNVRDSEHTGLVTLRVPFGPGARSNRRHLSPLERRMVETIVRDVDVVSLSPRSGQSAETAQINGVDIASATQVDGGAAGDLATAAAAGGANSVVIATGDFTPAAPVTLNQNQALLGGGSSLEVTTASGLTATYTAPGTRPTVSGVVDDSNNTADRVFVLSENANLTGVNIDAGEVGVYANAVDGITIVNNEISNMRWDTIAGPPLGGHAIHLNGDISGTVTDNTLDMNQGSGLHLTGNTINGGIIADNTITSDGTDGAHGIFLENFAAGTISGNVVRGYDLDLSGFGVTDDAYVNIGTMSGGTISNNTIESNTITNDGNVFALRIGQMTGGTISDNTVNGNTVSVTAGGDVAALYVDTMTGGTVNNNTVNGNTVTTDTGDIAAMFVNDMQGGTVSNNTVNGNTANGDLVGAFAAGNMSGGNVTGNTVDGNTANGASGGAGFAILNTFSGGSISDNTVSNNTNTSGSAPNGFYVNTFNGTAQLNNNAATNNSGSGYVIDNEGGSASATGNTGSGNTGGDNGYTYP